MYMDMANLAEFYIMSGKTDSARLMLDSLKRMEPVRRDIYLSEAYYCRGRCSWPKARPTPPGATSRPA